MYVPHYLHRYLIGPSGSVIRDIVERFGGVQKVDIKFPKTGIDTRESMNTVTISINGEHLDSLLACFDETIVDALGADHESVFECISREGEGCVSERFLIGKSDAEFVVGRNGEVLVDMLRKHGVTVWATPQGKDTELLVVGGADMTKNVSLCKKELLVFFFINSRRGYELPKMWWFLRICLKRLRLRTRFN